MVKKREIEPLNFDYRNQFILPENQFSAKRSRAKLVLSTIESGKTHKRQFGLPIWMYQNQFSPACGVAEIGFYQPTVGRKLVFCVSLRRDGNWLG